MTPILFQEKKNCCGCYACVSICPEHAIIMTADDEGFLYPMIQEGQCTGCGLCKKVCLFQTGYCKTPEKGWPIVIAAKHKSEEVRRQSSSGGAFTAVSDYILQLNGVIYGAAFDEQHNVIHDRAETEAARNRFRGSKYVQSHIGDNFQRIERDLKDGRYVLFTGTPCQSAGIKSYLELKRTEVSRLVLCDLVCHGTPSPLLWREHIRSIEQHYQSKVKDYCCRSKVNGWHSHTEEVELDNGTVNYASTFVQKHKNIFYAHVALRPSCHCCIYTTLQRTSDITIADFWGIEKVMPDFDDNKGVSLIILHNSKGKEIFESSEKYLDYRLSTERDCIQPQMQYPSVASPKRAVFWEDYCRRGYSYVVKKYAGVGSRAKIRAGIIKILQRTGALGMVKAILRSSST